MWFNFHTHSTYCDGQSTLAEIEGQAARFNFKSLGFSSHAPLPFDCKWCMPRERLEHYLSEIQHFNHLKKKIEIYSGLEVDYIPLVIGPQDFQKQLDYTIGSIHFVDYLKDGCGWEIDGAHQHFLEGFSEIFNGNIKDTVHRYFELTREMVTFSPPSIVGHLDKIKIQNIDERFFKEDEPWYREEIKNTLNTILHAGCIVEVNTRGIYRKKTATTYPSPWVLELIHQKEIPITVSSDAHHKDDLINNFQETLIDLRKIGFQEIHILDNGQWTPFKFNEHGLNVK